MWYQVKIELQTECREKVKVVVNIVGHVLNDDVIMGANPKYKIKT